jgi:hypothetical protein
MVLISSKYSSSRAFRSRAVNWCKRMSKMAWAWIFESSNFSIKAVRAASTFLDSRMVLITLSRLSMAMRNPSKMCARSSARFRLVLGAADHHLAAVFHVIFQHLPHGKDPGFPVDQRQHDDAEGRLHLGVLVELVQHHLGVGVPFDLDDDPDAVAVGFVTNIGNVFDFLSRTRSATVSKSWALLTW